MANPVPTLRGLLFEPNTKLSQLWEYFYTTESDQSLMFSDHIVSLPYLIAQFGEEPDTMAIELENALKALCQPYFDGVDVIVTHSIDRSGRDAYHVSLQVDEAGKAYSLSQSISNLKE